MDGDGSESSRWASANSELPVWVEVALPENTSFNTLVLSENIVNDWASARIEEFEFQIWDGSTYETIFTHNGVIGSSKVFKFDTQTTNQIRIYISALREDVTANSAGQTDPSITELGLYKY